MSLTLLVIVSATVSISIAESKGAKLNITKSKDLIADFRLCQDTNIAKDTELAISSELLKNTSTQYKKCDQNYKTKDREAKEWKSEFMDCSTKLVNCKKKAWWEIDLKSMGLGSILTLLAIIAL